MKNHMAGLCVCTIKWFSSFCSTLFQPAVPLLSGSLIGGWVGSQRSCEVWQRAQANTKVTKCVRLWGGPEGDLLLGPLTKNHHHVNSHECHHSSPLLHPPREGLSHGMPSVSTGGACWVSVKSLAGIRDRVWFGVGGLLNATTTLQQRTNQSVPLVFF